MKSCGCRNSLPWQWLLHTFYIPVYGVDALVRIAVLYVPVYGVDTLVRIAVL